MIWKWYEVTSKRTIFNSLNEYLIIIDIFFFFLQATKHMDLNMLVCANALMSSTIAVFLYCYVGSLTTDQFLRYGDISYESQWYKLPIDLQKFFQLIIVDAQRSLSYHGFGIIDLNLNAFTKIMRTVISYYMMFKRLTK